MSKKKEILDFIQRLPDEASMAELYFREQVERGLRDVVKGRTSSNRLDEPL